MGRTLIFYSPQDERRVITIHDGLKEHGHPTQLVKVPAKFKNSPGAAIEKAVSAASYCILIVSKHSLSENGRAKGDLDLALRSIEHIGFPHSKVLALHIDNSDIRDDRLSKYPPAEPGALNM